MELKRDDIIKALECCSLGDCYPCPYGKWSAGCRDEMCGDALSLIKELTEENERLRAEKESANKEAFHKWKKLADEIADRYEGLYQDAKNALVADTVRKMQERLKDKAIGFPNYTGEVIAARWVDQIAKEMLEGEDDNT